LSTAASLKKAPVLNWSRAAEFTPNFTLLEITRDEDGLSMPSAISYSGNVCHLTTQGWIGFSEDDGNNAPLAPNITTR
jgi:hypothetical protein